MYFLLISEGTTYKPWVCLGFVQTWRVYEMCKGLTSGVSVIKQAVVYQEMLVIPHCIAFIRHVKYRSWHRAQTQLPSAVEYLLRLLPLQLAWSLGLVRQKSSKGLQFTVSK